MRPERTACPECDLLITLPEVQEGQRADCPQCGNLLTTNVHAGYQRAMSFSIAALVFLALSMAFPFLSFSSSGFESVMTLPHAVLTIFKDQGIYMAAVVAVPIIVAPVLLLSLIIALTIPLYTGRTVSWLKDVGRMVFAISDWSMVEVFIVGVIVSLVKIAKMATVEVGLAFWAYSVFVVCLTAALTGLDRHRVWRDIESRSS